VDEPTFADDSEEGQRTACGKGADPRIVRILLSLGIGPVVVIVTVSVVAITAGI
jgi:hypothetical protein